MSDHLLLTVLGTADLHGHVLNWDYFADREFDRDGEKVGLAAVGTLVRRVREQRRATELAGAGEDRVLLVDAGDTIGGTQLAYYNARVEPITENRIHPMATAMNALGYDAAVPGNHDFDYGVPLLRDWQRQLTFPLLAANAFTRTGEQAFRPYLIRTVPGDELGPIRVGILGLTNPGTAIWDRCRLSGELTFPGLVEQARVWVPRIRRLGADVVVVLAHSGTNGRSSYSDAVPYAENAAAHVAAQVPGVDVVLAGHAHQEIDELVVINERTGKRVLITEPLAAGRRLSVVDLELVRENGTQPGAATGWRVRDGRASLLNANTAEEDRRIVELVSDAQDEVLRYVNTPIGTNTSELRTEHAACRPSVAVDLVNHVQAGTVRRGLQGTEYAHLPVLSLTALSNRAAVVPSGPIAIRHIAALYPFDNLLLAVRMTGGQLREYLETSARFFRRVAGTGPYRPDEVTNAPTDNYPDGTPNYIYDVLGGADARVEYDIDIAAGPGRRISWLRYAGKPVADDAEFVVAVNDYRQAGGGSFPHVGQAPVVYDRRQEVRQLLIEWVQARGRIDPSEFSGSSGSFWRLVAGTEPVRIVGS